MQESDNLSRLQAHWELVSAVEPDWAREKCRRWWDPSGRLLKSIRGYQRARAATGILSSWRSKWCVLNHLLWSAVSGADIPLDAKIEGGLALPHPNGVVIHPDAQVGPNCLIMQQVTLGVREGVEGAPRIRGHVDIGAGARILGPVVVGSHARVGANAVVLTDVPECATAVGVPARIIRPAVDAEPSQDTSD